MILKTNIRFTNKPNQKAGRKGMVVFFFFLLILFHFSSLGHAGRVSHVRIGTTMDVKKLGIDDRAYGVLMGLFTHRSLTRFSPGGDIIGDLSSSWDSPDSTVWTFELRPGMKWHDGEPVTAEDVVFTYKYLLDKFPVFHRHFNLMQDVRAINPLSVRIYLSRPNSRFMVNVCCIEILPKHIFQDVDDPRSFYGPEATVGCGPFVFESFERKSGILTFGANEAYLPARPNVDRVSLRFFKNMDTLYLALKKGEIDLPYSFPMETDPASLMSLKKTAYISFCSTKNIGVPKAIFFNTGKPPVDDPALRRALALAIDYRKMIDLISGGYGSWPNTGFAPPGTPGFIETGPVVHSPENARKSLAKLGYKTRNGDGILTRDGKPLVLDCMMLNGFVENRRVAELLTRDFKKIGVDFIPKYVDANVFQSMVNREKAYTMILHRTTPWGMMSWAGCGSAYVDERNMGWTSTEDDSLFRIIDRMNKAVYEKTYRAAAADLQRYYAENMVVAPLFWNSLVFPYNNRLTGWKTDCNNGLLNRESWFSLEEARSGAVNEKSKKIKERLAKNP